MELVCWNSHYHELTELERTTPNIHCYHVSVKEWEGDIVFLHQVKAGASPRSYGVHVGRLAGLPAVVTNRAETILKQLEGKQPAATSQQMPLFEIATSPAVPAKPAPSAADLLLADTNPDSLTPKQALDLLYELKELNKNDQSDHTKQVHGTSTKHA